MIVIRLEKGKSGWGVLLLSERMVKICVFVWGVCVFLRLCCEFDFFWMNIGKSGATKKQGGWGKPKRKKALLTELAVNAWCQVCITFSLWKRDLSNTCLKKQSKEEEKESRKC